MGSTHSTNSRMNRPLITSIVKLLKSTLFIHEVCRNTHLEIETSLLQITSRFNWGSYELGSWTIDAQLNQVLKFRYACIWATYVSTYIGHAYIQTYTPPFAPSKKLIHGPHLLSKCKNRYIHGLCIARHNKAIVNILFSNNLAR